MQKNTYTFGMLHKQKMNFVKRIGCEEVLTCCLMLSALISEGNVKIKPVKG